ncbi:MAG: DUF1553 domain-containing protein [Planctomycetaceae bacterium]|nr:DUF1553 domain-containing protein [Planctomycetaceae bacterium]
MSSGLLTGCRSWLFAAAFWPALAAIASANDSVPIVVAPAEVKLAGNFTRVQLVVTEPAADGSVTERSQDLTGQVVFASADAAIATVSPSGEILAVKDGQTTITVTRGDAKRDVPVSVSGVVESPVVSFTTDIRPILNKAGCAMAACHAAQHGKGGFKLSVFGFEPEKDRQAMVRDSVARRVDFVEPERSLLLLKPTMQTPHGGGKRISKGSVEYQVMLAWIVGGAPAPAKEDPTVTRLSVFPPRRVGQVGMSQQLRVEAEFSDGKRRDVTAWAKFDSLDDGVVSVTPSGLVTTVGRGQAPVMIRYDGQAEISLFVVPYGDKVELAGWQNQNFVDELAAAKFRELGIEPSPLADDATFVRRAFLDCVGTLPTPDETRVFLQSTDADKRTKLIDRLLGLTGDAALDTYNDAYAAWWSLKWSDLLRNNSDDLGEQGMWAMHNWIRESFRVNKPLDRFVRELVTARGSIYTTGPANYYRIHKDSSMLAEATAQIFLGVRLECAKCHHHPFEKYGQDDYYGMAAFFARTGTKNSEEFGLFGREQAVIVRDSGDVRHPRTNQVLSPKPLEGTAAEHPLDRRIGLADWLTAKDNPLFARSIANRYAGFLLGRGLVEPVDDMRSTNPASNPPLLDALAKHFVDSNYDLKQLVRAIMTSRLYQLDSQPSESNAADSKFFSHYAVKRLAAEPLIDAIDAVTGVRTKYPNLPLGTRAIELPDNEYPDYFLNTFAKPKRVSVCECERMPDPTLAQALHTLNGDLLVLKIRDAKSRVSQLLAAGKEHDEIVSELYLAALSREPSDAERQASRELLAEAPSPAEHYQDLLWALLNSKQFLFVR